MTPMTKNETAADFVSTIPGSPWVTFDHVEQCEDFAFLDVTPHCLQKKLNYFILAMHLYVVCDAFLLEIERFELFFGSYSRHFHVPLSCDAKLEVNAFGSFPQAALRFVNFCFAPSLLLTSYFHLSLICWHCNIQYAICALCSRFLFFYKIFFTFCFVILDVRKSVCN